MREVQEKPMLRRVIVSTEDLDRATAFYGDLLGLGVITRTDDFATLRLGPNQELLLHRRPTSPSDTAVAIGLSVAGLPARVDRWRAMGGSVIDEPRAQPWGEVMAVLRDPDGHVVCVSADVD
ncbi:VOC family protein [Agromyces sp. MMS24-JH15]|uniref:VOC family protein n=1 Tax=Agromyces sp. MMS24-JH15 TaxID=3243765 RepID=UPI00374A7A10